MINILPEVNFSPLNKAVLNTVLRLRKFPFKDNWWNIMMSGNWYNYFHRSILQQIYTICNYYRVHNAEVQIYKYKLRISYYSKLNDKSKISEILSDDYVDVVISVAKSIL